MQRTQEIPNVGNRVFFAAIMVNYFNFKWFSLSLKGFEAYNRAKPFQAKNLLYNY